MSTASIPVDLLNPGQVFACLGFLEAADVLVGDAEGGFKWEPEGVSKFILCTKGADNPFETVLEFLAEADLKPWAPIGYVDSSAKKRSARSESDALEDNGADECVGEGDQPVLELAPTFVARKAERMALPIKLCGRNGTVVELGHWADGSSRKSFKLYAGNRSAAGISTAMLKGVRKKPTAKQKAKGELGDLKTKGIMQLWAEDRTALVKAPFDVLTPMGGSFKFDPRGAWTPIDVGYSPDKQEHAIQASPVVEFLAAWGLEHARPEFDTRQVRYAVWGVNVPPMLARAALGGSLTSVPLRRFRFELDLSGKNKVITFAQEELRA